MKVVYNRFAVCEPLEIVDSDDSLLIRLEARFDVREKAAGIVKIQQLFNELPDDKDAIIAAVYELIEYIYGAEGAEAVRNLYGDNAAAISVDIVPHIRDVVAPAIVKASRSETKKRSFLRRFK